MTHYTKSTHVETHDFYIFVNESNNHYSAMDIVDEMIEDNVKYRVENEHFSFLDTAGRLEIEMITPQSITGSGFIAYVVYYLDEERYRLSYFISTQKDRSGVSTTFESFQYVDDVSDEEEEEIYRVLFSREQKKAA